MSLRNYEKAAKLIAKSDTCEFEGPKPEALVREAKLPWASHFLRATVVSFSIWVVEI